MQTDSARRGASEARADRVSELRRILEGAVLRHPAECMLLSGGLDTSILAHLARGCGLRSAVTVLVGAEAPDGPYAVGVARRIGLRHHIVRTDLEGLLEEADFVVKSLQTFDPMEIRNSIVIARALREAHSLGYRTLMTGDGADELFAGYSYMWSKPDEEFRRYSEYLARIMRFSSIPLGTALGLHVQTPYTDPEVVSFALTLSKDDKVGTRDGITHGKFLLRLAFPEVEAGWRRKDPIEVGSGSTRLQAYFQEGIPPEELEAERVRIAREERVEIRDAEHLSYYRIFRGVLGNSPPIRRFGEDPCPKCGFELPSRESTFCVTCGAWPVR